MKKLLISITTFIIISVAVCAEGSQSARYVRLLSRNTATDSIDSVYFNPAGTAFLEKGFHVQLNSKTVFLHYSYEWGSKTYTMINWIPVVLSAYAGYSGDNWAFFTGYSIPTGRRSLKWTIDDNSSTEVEISPRMLSVGGSYAFSPVISLGARIDISFPSAKYAVTISSSRAKLTKSGIGLGGALGIHIRLNKEINLSLTFESGQDSTFNEKSSSGSGNALNTLRNARYDIDRPVAFRFGFAYAFPFGLGIPISLKYSFWKGSNASISGEYYTYYKNEITAAMGFQYGLTEQLELSLGGSYASGHMREDKMDSSFLDPELASFTIGSGIGWEIFDDFNLDVGVLYPFYLKADGKLYKKLSKQVVDISLGIGYVF